MLIDIGFHPLDVKKGVDEAAKVLLEYLLETRSFVKNKKDLMNLAMITTNKDEEISEVISQALIAVGEKAIIQIEESNTGYTHLKVNNYYFNIKIFFNQIEEGMFITNGLASAEFMTFTQESSLILENPLVLVVKSSISQISDLVKTMEYIKSIERPLIIFSPEIKKEPLSLLLYNLRKENLNVNFIIIKMVSVWLLIFLIISVIVRIWKYLMTSVP